MPDTCRPSARLNLDRFCLTIFSFGIALSQLVLKFLCPYCPIFSMKDYRWSGFGILDLWALVWRNRLLPGRGCHWPHRAQLSLLRDGWIVFARAHTGPLTLATESSEKRLRWSRNEGMLGDDLQMRGTRNVDEVGVRI
jgi:hypothetical protein